MANPIPTLLASATPSSPGSAAKAMRAQPADAFEKTLAQANSAAQPTESSKAEKLAQPAKPRASRASRARKAESARSDEAQPRERPSKRKPVENSASPDEDAVQSDAAPAEQETEAQAAKTDNDKAIQDPANLPAIDLAAPKPLRATLPGASTSLDSGDDDSAPAQAASVEAFEPDGQQSSPLQSADSDGASDDATGSPAATDASFEKLLHELTPDASAKASGGADAPAAPVPGTSPQPAAVHMAAAPSDVQAAPSQAAAFAETNHPQLVSSIRAQLLPNGGSMHIRLDPPELGALQVHVEMRDGVMSASFQTSNDDATRLLSHSLGQLKQTLEAHGMSVEKLQVQQAPRERFDGARDDGSGQQPQDQSQQQEQQRRQMLQRMWRRLANGRDPLDLVA